MNMKKLIIPVVFVAGSFIHAVHGQNVEDPYEVATWQGFADAAISYTWDDNTAKQLTVAMPLYDQYGFDVTFFTALNMSPDWEDLQEADQNGHEIASHSVTHTSLDQLSDTGQEEELRDSQEEINTQLENDSCLTFAYPNCNTGNDNLTSAYYISARGCNGQIEQSTPADFMNVGSIVCGTQGAVSTETEFNTEVDEAAGSGGWAVFLLHGIDDDGGWSPVQSSELEPHLQYVNRHPEKFWVDTYGDVIRYIKERNNLQVTESTSNDSTILLSVTHDLDQQIYKHPVTLKRTIPDEWKNVDITQGNNTVSTEIESENNTNYVIFDVVPNRDTVVIERSQEPLGVQDGHGFRKSSFKVFPNPVVSKVNTQFHLKETGYASLKLLNSSGKVVRYVFSERLKPGTHTYETALSAYEGKVLYCVLTFNGKRYTKKIVMAHDKM